METLMAGTTDITNDHAVGIQGTGKDKKVVLAIPVQRPMGVEEALRLAAWIVALADPLEEKFAVTLAGVMGDPEE